MTSNNLNSIISTYDQAVNEFHKSLFKQVEFIAWERPRCPEGECPLDKEGYPVCPGHSTISRKMTGMLSGIELGLSQAVVSIVPWDDTANRSLPTEKLVLEIRDARVVHSSQGKARHLGVLMDGRKPGDMYVVTFMATSFAY